MRGRTAQRISTPKIQSRTLPSAAGPARRQLDFREFSPMTLSRAAVGQQMVPIVTRNVTTGRQTMSSALNPSGDRHAMQRPGMGPMNESTGASVALQEVK